MCSKLGRNIMKKSQIKFKNQRGALDFVCIKSFTQFKMDKKPQIQGFVD